MLKELSSLSLGMLILGGHVAGGETARWLADRCAADGVRRAPHASTQRHLGRMLEGLLLLPVWIGAPTLVILSLAALVRPV